MAYIGGCPAFFEAQNCNGIEEELTKTIDASKDRDLPKLSKESFAILKEDLAKNDQECQDFVGGMISDIFYMDAPQRTPGVSKDAPGSTKHAN